MVATLTTLALLAAAPHAGRGRVVHLRPGDRVAAAIAHHRPGTTFVFARGSYAITRTLEPRRGDRLLGRPGAVLTGARPVRGWRHPSPRYWVAAGQRLRPHRNNGAPGATLRHPQSRYDDNLFFGLRPLWKIGVRLHGRVIGQTLAHIRRGTYFVDYDHGRIYVGSSPSRRRPRLARAPTLIQSTASGVTVEGLVVQMSVARGISALGQRWRLLDNTSRLNGTVGIVSAGRALLDGNTVVRNGVYGITGHGGRITVRRNRISQNDLSRVDPAGGGCDDAGASKWVKTRGLRVVENRFDHNYCNGIWLDIANHASVISDNVVEDNAGTGIVHEISEGAKISGNRVRRNSGFGILVRSSRGDDVAGNTVSGNARGAIVIFGSLRSDHRSGAHVHRARNTSVHDNAMTLASPAMHVGILGDGSDPGVFDASSNHFDRNAYTLPFPAAQVFQFRHALDQARWQAAGEDRDSTFVVHRP